MGSPNLRCALINARSLSKNLSHFRCLLSEGMYDIIFVVETWLNTSYTDPMITGSYPYLLFRLDRGSRAGGVLVAYRQHIQAVCATSSVDIEAITVLLPTFKLFFMLVYQPDSYCVPYIESVCSFISQGLKQNFTNIILGDFNLSTVDWRLGTAVDRPHRIFLDLFLPLGFDQIVDFPTRGRNILDLIFVNDPRCIYNAHPLDYLGTSDHYMVDFCIQLDSQNPSPSQAGLHRGKIDFPRLRAALATVDWPALLLPFSDDLDELWEVFWTHLGCNVEACRRSPIGDRTYRSDRQPNCIRNLCHRKLDLWRAACQNPTPEAKLRYSECRRKYQTMVDNWHNSVERAALADGSLSALFRLYRQKTHSNRTIPPLSQQDIFITDPTEKAELFNRIFVANGIVDNETILPYYQGSYPADSLSSVELDASDILRSIYKLKSSHAIGPDGYSSFFYKQVGFEIHLALLVIFNCSLSKGKLPTQWKNANVVPIFKKGNQSDPLNYRPIALTSVPCKLLESLIRSSLLRFLTEHNLLDPDQYGFLPHKSTTLQLLTLLDRWSSALDVGVPTDVIYFDFSKAFESVVHTKLIYKLSRLGISGALLNWLGDFITGRTQCVKVASVSSSRASLISGVPQGSVLGPLLFVVYLNDLNEFPNDTGRPRFKFADDLKASNDIISFNDGFLLEGDIAEIFSWSETWQLPLSLAKCFVLHIGKSNPHFCYNLSTHPLSVVSETRDLGVWMSTDLKFTTHCCKITSQAYQRLALVNRCFSTTNIDTRIWAYKTYVRPILEYASPVWSPHLLGDIDKLEGVQRRFTRSLPGLGTISANGSLIRCGLLLKQKVPSGCQRVMVCSPEAPMRCLWVT